MMQEILGIRTAADINLAAQLLLLAGLLAGFWLARQKRFDQHANVQTAMVLLNLVFIALVMVPSFYGYVVAGGTTTGRVAQFMIAHGILGVVVEVFAIYLILRMRTGMIPKALRIGNIKLAMRTTLALWTLLVLLGVGIYAERYLFDRDVASAPLAEFRQLGADLYVHAVELDDAVKRGSAPAVKRHAEHLINLIEGKEGLHYGDNDIDGNMEDPGDGEGLLARLDAVAGTVEDPAAVAQAETMRGQLDGVVDASLGLLGTQNVEDAGEPAAEVVELARQANGDGVFVISQAAADAGIAQAPGISLVVGPEGETATVTVHEIDFAFLPEEMTVPSGTTVIWVNDEVAKHTATADDGLFDSGDQSLGDTYSYTFSEPGTYPYFCRYHGDVGGIGMAGTITVD
jgi:plastocyanin/uncharacterized membrane protein YozB (DUF420 family)